MPMMDAMAAGPMLGDEDGRRQVDPDLDGDTDMVPCPHCQGSGMMPADEALNPDMAQDIEQGVIPPPPGEGPPTSPVTGRTAADLEGVRSYKENRPSQLQHQPLDEEQVLTSGQRIRERMRQPGRLGR